MTLPSLRSVAFAVAILGLHCATAHAQSHGGSAKEKEKEEPKAPSPFRVVERDGTMRVGKLVFKGAGFLVEADPKLKAAEDDAAGDEPGDREGEGDPAGGGGRGGGGGGGGGRGGGGGGGQGIGLDYLTKIDAPFGRLERVEQDQKLQFQANRTTCVSHFATQDGFSGGYGDMRFVLSKEWEILEAQSSKVIALQRDETGDIIGRIRVYLLEGGDGQSAQRTLEAGKTKPGKIFRKLDRARFAKLDVKTETDEMLASGVKVRRVVRAGIELVSDQPCHLEVDVPSDGAFFPAFEILARGPKKDQIVEQCRTILETFTYVRDKAVAPEATIDDGKDATNPLAGLKLRDLMTMVQSIGSDANAEFVIKGKYENPYLGVAVKANLPEGWAFFNASEAGCIAVRVPAPNTGMFDYGFSSIAVLDGTPVSTDPTGWVCDRFLAGLPPVDDPKLAPKPKKSKLGQYPDKEFVSIHEYGSRGNEARVAVHAIEHLHRIVIAVRLTNGVGTQPAKCLDEILKWLKAIALDSPKPKPA